MLSNKKDFLKKRYTIKECVNFCGFSKVDNHINYYKLKVMLDPIWESDKKYSLKEFIQCLIHYKCDDLIKNDGFDSLIELFSMYVKLFEEPKTNKNEKDKPKKTKK